MLNIEYRFPEVPKKYFHTNYANIPQLVQEIEEYVTKNGNTHLLIPDVSFSDNKEYLARLYRLFDHVTHIDHHLYPNGFWNEFPNMKVVWDKTKCATKLCNEYFGNAGKNDRLDKLTYIIDVYDLWQTKNSTFDTAQDLNEFFWKYDIGYLTAEIVKRDYRLPEGYRSVVDGIHQQYKEAVKDYESRQLIQRAGDVTIAFVNDWFNQILIKEMANGQNIVIGANSYGIIRVRIKEDAPISDKKKDEMRLELTGTKDIGHMNAFTYKMKGTTNFENLINEVQKVVSIYNKLTSED